MQKEAKRGEKCAVMGFEPMTHHFLAACATTELGCRLYDVVEVHDVTRQYDTSYYVVRRAVRQLRIKVLFLLSSNLFGATRCQQIPTDAEKKTKVIVRACVRASSWPRGDVLR